mgnify:CR=1 FL=1
MLSAAYESGIWNPHTPSRRIDKSTATNATNLSNKKYDLTGREVMTPSKGLYIVNGVKRIICWYTSKVLLLYDRGRGKRSVGAGMSRTEHVVVFNKIQGNNVDVCPICIYPCVSVMLNVVNFVSGWQNPWVNCDIISKFKKNSHKLLQIK